MSKEEELLLGYSPTELQVGEERKRSLSSVISRLSEEWNLRVDSPEKLSDSRSRNSRRGSLDLPRSGGKSLRSRSCDTASLTTHHNKSAKRDLGKSMEIEPIQESPSEDALENDKPIEKVEPAFIEIEAAASGEMTEPENNVFSTDDEETSNEKIDKSDVKSSAKEDTSENKSCIEENTDVAKNESSEEKVATPLDESVDSLEDMEILEKVLEVVPEKGDKEQESSVENVPRDTNTPRETRRTRTSASSVTNKEEKSSLRETRTRGAQKGEDTASPRESRARTSGPTEMTETGSGGGRETRGSRSISLPNSQTNEDGKTVRETRARSRAVAEVNQPPARSTRSNRDSTPDTKKLGDSSKKRVDSLSRLKRSGNVTSELESTPSPSSKQRKPSDVEQPTTTTQTGTTPERRSTRRGQDEPLTGGTPNNEPRSSSRKSSADQNSSTATPSDRRTTRSLETVEPASSNKPSTSSRSVENEAAIECVTPRGTRHSADSEDKKSDDFDENASLGRRLRSLRTDQTESTERSSSKSKKHQLSASRSPPMKRLKAEHVKSESTKEGVVIALKKKKKKLMVEKGKAFHEADVIRRVQELKIQGLWTEKKVPKMQSEPKTKVHWDFVLEEMTWLSDVVQKELKIKRTNAKKCAAMVQKYFKDKELATIRAEKAREANLRKIAANMAREVKAFWANAQKLFEWRVKQKLERKHKEALDQHLQFIVDKTEKYSTLLAESLAESASGQVSRAGSVCSGSEENDDREYAPDSGSSDDEETIEKEESQAKGDIVEASGTVDEELAELEAGAEVPIEELLKKYYPDQFEKIKDEDKTEIKEENKEEVKKEDNLNDKNNLGVDASKPSTSNADNDTSIVTSGRRRRKPIDFAEVERKIKEENEKGIFGLGAEKSSDNKNDIKIEKKEDEGKKESGEKDPLSEDKLEEYANMAAKFQPTGNTLETTAVKTKIPSLLKHTLREYQHIGLDWMVSLYERGLNGILADEMGLGKTIQTIALLAHLAVDRANWGPHLIVVPTSVMLNWEMEIKKWCPGFKVLVYYGSQKERKMKRIGWTKQNAFHICITSYKLVIQDHSSFRRKQWQYFILDEAQHIKNFKSQRWQLLLNFASVGRLLLTGTPLQNNLMELWSLMHFLMPHVFESHRDFKEWFSNPLTGMVEGNNEYNDNLIKRLHKVLRPFILRRLKSEVEKQLPKKYEHLVKCPLSKRQRYLYDDFMSRAKTRETLAAGNLLSVINVLMQLRKCCNHPNLFEPRPTLSPFVMDMVDLRLPRLVQGCLDYDVHKQIDLSTTGLNLLHHELNVDPYTVFRASCLATSNSRMMKPPEDSQLAHLSCPVNKMRMEVKSQRPVIPKHDFEHHSPVLSLPLSELGYVIPVKTLSNRDLWLWQAGHKLKTPSGYFQIRQVPIGDPAVTSQIDSEGDVTCWTPPKKIIKLENSEKKIAEANNTRTSESTDQDQTLGQLEYEPRRRIPRTEIKKSMRGIFSLGLFASDKLTFASRSPNKAKKRRLEAKAREAELFCEDYNQKKEKYIHGRRDRNYKVNLRRCDLMPLYGSDLVDCVEQMSLLPSQLIRTRLEQLTCNTFNNNKKINDGYKDTISCYSSFELIQTLGTSYKRIEPLFERFILNVPNAWVTNKNEVEMPNACREVSKEFPGSQLVSRFQIHMPDTRLIQYDCGKLQILSSLLRKLHLGGHRALIFTQMTRMLDVLESFLNYHGYVYMRLDGATKVETRQALMERFNNNSKYFIFILSTRSGGVGINLTGADTVIFYDSDWNPTMDAQAQDRCHRIGQTRDVHIYRLISERTVEENILKKANQKRLLGDLAIEGGNFTTAFFKKQTIHDLFEEQATATTDDLIPETSNDSEEGPPKKSVGAFESALATAEDDTDRQATKDAKAEENIDEQDFNEQTEEDQFNAILAELSKVEVYALKHIENDQEGWVQGQLAAAQAEIEARKEEFDAEKLEELTQEIREEMGDISSEGGMSDGGQESDDYSPGESGSDDEETIEKDEKEVDEKNNDNEVNMLENEAEVPIEELIKQYYPDQYIQMDLGSQDVDGNIIIPTSNDTSVENNEALNATVESEEFHIETLEHVSQEIMEHVQEGFDISQIVSDSNQVDLEAVSIEDVNETVGHISQPLVNGNDEVHVAVLENHENVNSHENQVVEDLDSIESTVIQDNHNEIQDDVNNVNEIENDLALEPTSHAEINSTEQESVEKDPTENENDEIKENDTSETSLNLELSES